mmetsp:Transcript_17235/g.20296  ORF Transcript_17235/g.20296 Transcript_17235/m.20296 type:complete len:224 (-) Transcript_17235:822-1493(-)
MDLLLTELDTLRSDMSLLTLSTLSTRIMGFMPPPIPSSSLSLDSLRRLLEDRFGFVASSGLKEYLEASSSAWAIWCGFFSFSANRLAATFSTPALYRACWSVALRTASSRVFFEEKSLGLKEAFTGSWACFSLFSRDFLCEEYSLSWAGPPYSSSSFLAFEVNFNLRFVSFSAISSTFSCFFFCSAAASLYNFSVRDSPDSSSSSSCRVMSSGAKVHSSYWWS